MTNKASGNSLNDHQMEDLRQAEKNVENLLDMAADAMHAKRGYFNDEEKCVTHHISPEAVIHVTNYRPASPGKAKKIDGKTRMAVILTTKDDAIVGEHFHCTGMTLGEAFPDGVKGMGGVEELVMELDLGRSKYITEYADGGTRRLETGTHEIYFKLR